MCADDLAAVQDLSVQMCVSVFSILISLQPALIVPGNSELEVRHVVLYVLKMRATFPINLGVSSLRVTSIILKRKWKEKNSE